MVLRDLVEVEISESAVANMQLEVAWGVKAPEPLPWWSSRRNTNIILKINPK